MVKERTGQNWSIDLLVGIVIFLSLALFFYTVARDNVQENTGFDNSADILVDRLDATNYPPTYNQTPTPIRGFSIQKDQLETFYNTSYDDLKQRLGIQRDFCILLVDDEDSIISVNVSGTQKFSVGENGSPVQIADGLNCGQ